MVDLIVSGLAVAGVAGVAASRRPAVSHLPTPVRVSYIGREVANMELSAFTFEVVDGVAHITMNQASDLLDRPSGREAPVEPARSRTGASGSADCETGFARRPAQDRASRRQSWESQKLGRRWVRSDAADRSELGRQYRRRGLSGGRRRRGARLAGLSAHWRADNENPALSSFLGILGERYLFPTVGI
jgi:hypothetical protein